jgi:PhzF family phenazine biosynthesis protein
LRNRHQRSLIQTVARLPFYWIDTFTSRAFAGNPAAVVPLAAWLPDEELQQMARQHGLSETAYFVAAGDGTFALRWFTPEREVDLCGHATLASATVIFDQQPHLTRVHFTSASGPLMVGRDSQGRYELDFPSRPPVAVDSGEKTDALLAALGITRAHWIGKSRDHFVVLPDQASVAALQPDFDRMVQFDTASVIVTAPGHDYDFVSRNFAPGYGIDEDPVTGSAHCTLVPYWAEHLQKTSLRALQISTRGGELWCTSCGDRVKIAGEAVIYLRGELNY